MAPAAVQSGLDCLKSSQSEYANKNGWMIGVITFVFNAMGVINLFVQMTANLLASFPEVYRPTTEDRPAWASAAKQARSKGWIKAK